MEIIEKLKKLRTLNYKINILEETLLKQEQKMYKLNQVLGELKSDGEKKDFSEVLLIFIEKKEKIKNLINTYAISLKEIYKELEVLDEIEFKIIEYRFVQGLKWEEIIKKTHYSESSVFRICNKAFEKLRKSNNKSI